MVRQVKEENIAGVSFMTKLRVYRSGVIASVSDKSFSPVVSEHASVFTENGSVIVTFLSPFSSIPNPKY